MFTICKVEGIWSHFEDGVLNESLIYYTFHFINQNVDELTQPSMTNTEQHQAPLSNYQVSTPVLHHHDPKNELSSEKMLMVIPSEDDPKIHKTNSFCMITPSATSLDEEYVCDILGGSLPEDLGKVSPGCRSKIRRSQSCGVRSEAHRHGGSGVRFHIGYRDENLRERCQRNTQELLQTAANQATAQSTSTILARKALRYRRIMERTEGADMSNPAFDLTEHLGVRWQRVIPPSVSIDQNEEEEKEEKESG